MKLKGSDIPIHPNPANPLRDNDYKKEKLTYYIDLDGTLAYYDRWSNEGDIGEPIEDIKNKILRWISEDITIKIFTARAYCNKNIKVIRKWLLLNGLPPTLEITNIKGIDCNIILDDKAREVIKNTGIIVDRTTEFK